MSARKDQLSTRIPRTVDILLFFALAPGEELTYDDVAEKFSIPRRSVSIAIRSWIVNGMLSTRIETSVRTGGRRWYVLAGPELLRRVAPRLR